MAYYVRRDEEEHLVVRFELNAASADVAAIATAAAATIVEIHRILYCRTLHLLVNSSEMISFASNLISFLKAD